MIDSDGIAEMILAEAKELQEDARSEIDRYRTMHRHVWLDMASWRELMRMRRLVRTARAYADGTVTFPTAEATRLSLQRALDTQQISEADLREDQAIRLENVRLREELARRDLVETTQTPPVDLSHHTSYAQWLEMITDVQAGRPVAHPSRFVHELWGLWASAQENREATDLAERRIRDLERVVRAADVRVGMMREWERALAMQATLRGVVTNLRTTLESKNREMDALHYIWCDGGCASGAHRYDGQGGQAITDDVVDRAVDGLRSMLVARDVEGEAGVSLDLVTTAIQWLARLLRYRAAYRSKERAHG